jgi:hypothetical protein
VDFIFMLTRNDATVENCLDIVGTALDLGLTHIGFKDVGVETGILHRLADAIRAGGATSYLEIVSTTRESELASVRAALALGVDRLLGGVHVDEALAILAGSSARYLPFAGRPFGHPTQLAGDSALVEAQCRAYRAMGCAGVDLLAYRATEAEPLDLVRAARRGLGDEGILVAAGSVSSRARIQALRAAGVDAFTIGTAAIEGTYAPARGGLRGQLEAALEDCAAS